MLWHTYAETAVNRVTTHEPARDRFGSQPQVSVAAASVQRPATTPEPAHAFIRNLPSAESVLLLRRVPADAVSARSAVTTELPARCSIQIDPLHAPETVGDAAPIAIKLDTTSARAPCFTLTGCPPNIARSHQGRVVVGHVGRPDTTEGPAPCPEPWTTWQSLDSVESQPPRRATTGQRSVVVHWPVKLGMRFST